MSKRGIPDTTQYVINAAHIQAKGTVNKPDPVADLHMIK